MSDYNSNDINDAKRRVEEMRRRAQSFTQPEQIDNSSVAENTPNANQNSFNLGSLLSGFGIDSIGGDSSLILALILILSREGADNMLILALLYILL